jgi:hypothetical protein
VNAADGDESPNIRDNTRTLAQPNLGEGTSSCRPGMMLGRF